VSSDDDEINDDERTGEVAAAIANDLGVKAFGNTNPELFDNVSVMLMVC
jgi:hypothetical protein